MEAIAERPQNLKELRQRTGLTAREVADKIGEYLNEKNTRTPESVLMMERRNRVMFGEVRDALIAIYGEYKITPEEVQAAYSHEKI